MPVSSVTAADLQMKVGDPLRDPTLTWTPANATNKGYTLTSLNTALLVISGNQLKAVAPGTANALVASTDGNKTDTFSVAITQPVVSISVADITMEKGDPDREPTVTFNPSNASTKTYSLVSLNPTVAAVSPGKLIHAAAAGTAKFVATSTDGAKVDTFLVNVVIPVTKIQAMNMSLRLGDPGDSPNVTYSPPDASDKAYHLTSEDPFHRGGWG